MGTTLARDSCHADARSLGPKDAQDVSTRRHLAFRFLHSRVWRLVDDDCHAGVGSVERERRKRRDGAGSEQRHSRAESEPGADADADANADADAGRGRFRVERRDERADGAGQRDLGFERA